jgi:hypothetical protein
MLLTLLKDHNGLCTLQAYGHTLSTINNKHHENYRIVDDRLLWFYIQKVKKEWKQKMKTTISLYDKENKIIPIKYNLTLSIMFSSKQ